MQKNEIIHSIRETARQVMPSGSRVILFGSQARGDAHHESDWDILILLDKSRIYNEDFDRVAYPLVELGWKIGADINPLIYTYTDWQRRSFTLFYKNVEQEGIYNPQIQISAESETKRSIFREKDKTKRSKKESAQHSKSRNKSFVMTSVSAL